MSSEKTATDLNAKALEAALAAAYGSPITDHITAAEIAIRAYLEASGIGAVLALLPEWATASDETHSHQGLSDLVERLEKAVLAMNHPVAAMEDAGHE